MELPKLVLWSTMATTFGLYLLMMVWTLPAISQAADGLTAFDLRYFGYNLIDASRFLEALSPAGKSLYLGVHFPLDQIYASLLAISSILAIRAFCGHIKAPVQVALIIAALLGATFDWFENYLIRHMLAESSYTLDQGLVQTSSIFTSLKVCFQLAPVIFVALVLIQTAVYRKNA